jgi:Cu-Zn family superoxide dismutase
MTRIFALAAAAGLAAASAQAAAPMVADMRGPDGQDTGEVTLRETPAGVLIDARLRNLPEGVHAFHVHETGACEPDFQAAGGHLAGDADAHGFLETDEPHAGDMPNLHIPASGELRIEILNTRIQIKEGGLLTDDAAIRDEDGAALIIHAGADDYRSQPAGDSGARIACGVIEPGG